MIAVAFAVAAVVAIAPDLANGYVPQVRKWIGRPAATTAARISRAAAQDDGG
jgi:hypothetical protein